jgi:hypothetical protein
VDFLKLVRPLVITPEVQPSQSSSSKTTTNTTKKEPEPPRRVYNVRAKRQGPRSSTPPPPPPPPEVTHWRFACHPRAMLCPMPYYSEGELEIQRAEVHPYLRMLMHRPKRTNEQLARAARRATLLSSRAETAVRQVTSVDEGIARICTKLEDSRISRMLLLRLQNPHWCWLDAMTSSYLARNPGLTSQERLHVLAADQLGVTLEDLTLFLRFVGGQ